MKKDTKEKLKSPLRQELEYYKKQGVELWLDGQPGTPKSISRACRIAEEGDYMRDYVFDEKGDDLKEVYFCLVKNSNDQ